MCTMDLLDDLDRRLIAELRVNAREPMASIARRLQVTRATVQARLDRLISSGTVVGFSVRLREGAHLDAVRAMSLIEVRGRNADAVIRTLRGFPEVVRLHTTSGGWDLVAELETRTLGEFDQLLGRMRAVDGVLNTETSLLLSSVLR